MQPLLLNESCDTATRGPLLDGEGMVRRYFVRFPRTMGFELRLDAACGQAPQDVCVVCATTHVTRKIAASVVSVAVGGLDRPGITYTPEANAFIRENGLEGAAERIVDFLGRHDLTEVELRRVEGDFEGEYFLEFLVRSTKDVDNLLQVDSELRRQILRNIPLEKGILLMVNFRVR
jgi:hypothetical protein